jgi:hypothetical protein
MSGGGSAQCFIQNVKVLGAVRMRALISRAGEIDIGHLGRSGFVSRRRRRNRRRQFVLLHAMVRSAR